MSIVEEIYNKNTKITDLELADEIVKHKELTCLDLWLLPQYPFDIWRRKYDYPRIITNIKNNQKDFVQWMEEQKLTDDHLLNGYLSDFISNKSFSKDKTKYLIRVSYKGEVSLQSWNSYNGEKSHEGDGEPVLYEFISKYISYYDWKPKNNEKFNFVKTFQRYNPNTEKEEVYLNSNIRLLKMGGVEPPINGIGELLRGKKIEFINVSGLNLKGTIYSSNLSFHHCAVDNLICNELEMPALDFRDCSIRNIQIRNSYIRHWLFISCETTGNIIDSKLNLVRIFGGQFNPAFSNSEFGKIEIRHEEINFDKNFDKSFRALAKCAKESGNNDLYRELKIKENDFIRKKSTGFSKLLKTIDKVYWEYGQKPTRLIYVTLFTIICFGFLYSFFPNEFKNNEFCHKNYLEILYNTQYYSVVTFTTLGYGDIIPTGIVKSFAAVEALFGAITMGFLVAGLARTE